MNNSNGVQSELMSLEKVFNQSILFQIPSYQRPYVWSDDDVLKLFEDIKNACFRKEHHYFIGTTLSSSVEGEKPKVLELVDGQQRTTTLLLMCMAFRYAGIESEMSDLAVYEGEGENENTPRLRFEIRESVRQLFGAKAGLKSHQMPSPEQIQSNPYLTQIDAALTVLEKEVKKLIGNTETEGDTSEEKVSIKELGDFIYNKVQWVNNTVPPNTDLNRLFATMNTAGVQLEQSDILKAKLLKYITCKKTKLRYEAIWSACEQMENYFERNVRQVFPNTNWKNIDPDDLAEFDDKFISVIPQSTAVTEGKGKTIAQLLESLDKNGDGNTGAAHDHSDTQAENVISSGTDEPNRSVVHCRSIISFPLLLIHVYRIFRSEQDSKNDDIHRPVHSKYLLEIFKPLLGEPYSIDSTDVQPASTPDEECIKRFFHTLWRVRYVFDRWVVKWVERDDENEQSLGLTTQSTSDSNGRRYINRSERSSPEAMLMLQSVRYFTSDRNAQYWLTPFLACLLKEQVKKDCKALVLLERIDDHMSLAKVTRKEASFAYAAISHIDMKDWATQKEYFQKSLGTGFGHYWFQKLEYLLWKKNKSELNDRNENEKVKFEKYRITSRNSVEHVHPQQEENKKELCDRKLHSFGNLALLSPSENSSYSNQSVGKKFIDFQAKNRFDSLKLKEIFELYCDLEPEHTWTADKISKHRDDMLEILAAHYRQKT